MIPRRPHRASPDSPDFLRWLDVIHRNLDPLPRVAVFSGTRDASVATGTQAITGIGFKPKAVVSFSVGTSGGGDQASVSGTSDGTLNKCLETGITGQNFFQGSFLGIWRTAEGGGDFQSCVVSTFDTDGLTLSWTKSGTPTGTISFYGMALG